MGKFAVLLHSFVTNSLQIMRRDVFQAIADPTRREIMGLLADKTLTLNSVAENFDISRPAISKHIKILSECGLIAIEQKGRERYCHAHPERLREVSEWVSYFHRFWDDKLLALKTHLENNNP